MRGKGHALQDTSFIQQLEGTMLVSSKDRPPYGNVDGKTFEELSYG